MDGEKKKKKKRNRKRKPKNLNFSFELVLADGRKKNFVSGRDMYNWAASTNKDWEFPERGNTNYKGLTQWFEDRHKKKAK